MKILVLNGSPHLNGSTSDMVNAFAQGAKEAAGIFTANGEQNKSREKRDELYGFGKSLKN